jgi:hypothetical protein
MEKRLCGCPVETGPFADLFGPDLGPCRRHSEILSLYNHAFFAMAGNIYSQVALAEEGLIPGVRPTLGDMDRAATILFAQLSPEQRAAEQRALEEV